MNYVSTQRPSPGVWLFPSPDIKTPRVIEKYRKKKNPGLRKPPASQITKDRRGEVSVVQGSIFYI